MDNTVFHNCNTMSVTTMHKYYHFDDIIKVSQWEGGPGRSVYDHLSLLSNLNHNLKLVSGHFNRFQCQELALEWASTKMRFTIHDPYDSHDPNTDRV